MGTGILSPLVHDERVKLAANSIDRLATASIAAIFYLYLLPVLLAASVWGAIWVSEWRSGRHKKLHPGE